MKKLLALMLMLVLSAPIFVISTEREVNLTNDRLYKLSNDVVKQVDYFDTVPENPALLKTTMTFSDPELTQPKTSLVADSPLEIEDLLINEDLLPVFVLADGGFIVASRNLIYDDLVLSQEKAEVSYWTKADFTLYDSPYVHGSKKIKGKLSSYQKVTTTQKAVTHHGNYYLVSGQGWIAEEDLSEQDNRMEKVQAMLDKKYNKGNLAIYVKQVNSQQTAGINADKAMYSASVAKLPILYYVQEAIQKGQIKTSDKLKYIPEVNSFDGAYKVEGSGDLPKKADNKDYSVEDLLKAVSQHSDNVASNILGYYIAKQYDETYQTKIKEIAESDWNMTNRNVSVKTAANVMEALYDQDGSVLTYLSQTDFDDDRIAKDISVQVSHKIGDAYDYKHDVAIVYADQPFVLAIFTDKSSYKEISAIADDIYGILK